MRRKKTFMVLAVVLFLAAVVGGAYYYGQSVKDIEKITYVEFMGKANDGEVATIYLSDSPNLDGQFADGTRFVTQNPRSEGFKESMLVLGIKVEEGQRNSALLSALRVLLVMGILIFSVWAISRLMNKGSAQ